MLPTFRCPRAQGVHRVVPRVMHPLTRLQVVARAFNEGAWTSAQDLLYQLCLAGQSTGQAYEAQAHAIAQGVGGAAGAAPASTALVPKVSRAGPPRRRFISQIPASITDLEELDNLNACGNDMTGQMPPFGFKKMKYLRLYLHLYDQLRS